MMSNVNRKYVDIRDRTRDLSTTTQLRKLFNILPRTVWMCVCFKVCLLTLKVGVNAVRLGEIYYVIGE